MWPFASSCLVQVTDIKAPYFFYNSHQGVNSWGTTCCIFYILSIYLYWLRFNASVTPLLFELRHVLLVVTHSWQRHVTPTRVSTTLGRWWARLWPNWGSQNRKWKYRIREMTLNQTKTQTFSDRGLCERAISVTKRSLRIYLKNITHTDRAFDVTTTTAAEYFRTMQLQGTSIFLSPWVQVSQEHIIHFHIIHLSTLPLLCWVCETYFLFPRHTMLQSKTNAVHCGPQVKHWSVEKYLDMHLSATVWHELLLGYRKYCSFYLTAFIGHLHLTNSFQQQTHE